MYSDFNQEFWSGPQTSTVDATFLGDVFFPLFCALSSHKEKSISWVKKISVTSLINLSSTPWVLSIMLCANPGSGLEALPAHACVCQDT